MIRINQASSSYIIRDTMNHLATELVDRKHSHHCDKLFVGAAFDPLLVLWSKRFQSVQQSFVEFYVCQLASSVQTYGFSRDIRHLLEI